MTIQKNVQCFNADLYYPHDIAIIKKDHQETKRPTITVIINTTVKVTVDIRDFIFPEINKINSKIIATTNKPILIIVVTTKAIMYK